MTVEGRIRSVPLGIILRREKSNEVDGGQRLRTCEAVGCMSGEDGPASGITVLHQESRYLKWQRGKGSGNYPSRAAAIPAPVDVHPCLCPWDVVILALDVAACLPDVSNIMKF